jgi:hypothetical protein
MGGQPPNSSAVLDRDSHARYSFRMTGRNAHFAILQPLLGRVDSFTFRDRLAA